MVWLAAEVSAAVLNKKEENMKLKREVAVKSVVTEEFKSRLKQELIGMQGKMQAAIEELDLHLKRFVPEIAKNDIEQAGRLRREITNERQRHERAMAEIEARLREIEGLAIGDEYYQGKIDGEVEIAVGDDLEAKIYGAEIVVKDGKVQEIREG